jgi:hypothetical protein
MTPPPSPLLATSGTEALDLIRGGDPLDAAILDMLMPEMDSLTLAASYTSPTLGFCRILCILLGPFLGHWRNQCAALVARK